MITNQRIGIDIGNVIIGGVGLDTSFFTGEFLKTPAVPGYRRALKALNRGNELFFISKCGSVAEDKTRRWFEEHSVLYFLELPEDRLFFTKTRTGKVPIAQSLDLNVFIDDRADICKMMRAVGIRTVQFKSWIDTLKELSE